MDERTLRVLEFEKIRERLAERATFSAGKERCRSLQPLAHRTEIEAAQAETAEAAGILRGGQSPPLGGLNDIKPLVIRAKAGSMLEPSELLDLQSTLAASRALRQFLADRQADYPRLGAIGLSLGHFGELEKAIRHCINERGEVVDSASPELSRIRQEQRVLQGRIKDRLESYLRNPETARLLQETIVTMRDGRYVLPVRQENRGHFPGIIHDQSGTGATLYIEPMPVVELGNDLRQLQVRERDEIIRILRELSGRIGARADELKTTADGLASLDFIFAKGRFALDLRCTQPEINDQGQIILKKARHPLLTGNVVPIDLTLGLSFDTLVITGPNTGGKTVTLKTVGLLSLMAASGLHVPAETGSELSFFEAIYCDIGDEQSIEQSLSTFSSHMGNIVGILQRVNDRSLVLLDELGAGTDPAEGAALAMAILEFLHGLGARTVATTHYSELKTFAFTAEGIENASVEFDVDTLRPTYRLFVGIPGMSNAFEISRRLGLLEGIIDRARQYLKKDDLRVEHLIAQIQQNHRALEEERRQAAEDARHARRAREEAERRLAELKERQREMVQKAREEALAIINRARRESDDLIAALRAVQQSQALAEGERAISQVRAGLKGLRQETVGAMFDLTETERSAGDEPLRPGDLVVIRSLQQEGRVIGEPTPEGQVMVQAGIMRINASVSDLQKVEGAEEKQTRARLGGLMTEKAAALSGEIHLRGMTIDDALFRLEKYLDDAVLAGISRVRVVHGKGTGALRQAVREYLQRHPHVREQRPALATEGGDGVTVAVFK